MRGCTLLLVITLSVSLFAQTEQHGIQVGDLDRNADPCTDFFHYANGTWRAQNPIPNYMDRWSRRWESGEKAKDQLKVILEDVSSGKAALSNSSAITTARVWMKHGSINWESRRRRLCFGILKR